MSRDEVRKILGENATEEQITALLNNLHQNDDKKELEKIKLENEKLKKDSQELEKIKLEKMTNEELIAKRLKEAEEKANQANLIYNKAKAKNILSSVGFEDEDIIDSIVTKDETITTATAQKLADRIKQIYEDTEKKTLEKLSKVDLKPNGSNTQNNNGVVTRDDFYKMTLTEQIMFKREHPEDYERVK